MTETPDAKPPEPAPAGPAPEQSAKAERARRLAAALRDNLKRRKAARPAAATRSGN